MKKLFRRYFIFIFIFLIIILGIVLGYFFKSDVSYQNPELATNSEARNLVLRVGELILLPTNEVPTVATVSDLSLLKDQAFFKNAKNGDKVLIYANAGKAILYDPVVNKIIEVGTANVGDFQKSSAIQNKESTSLTPNEF